MTLVAQRLRDARDRTVESGSARMWTAAFDDSAQGEAPPVETTGVIDFFSGNALLERRVSLDGLQKIVSAAVYSVPEHVGEQREVSLFIADQEYSPVVGSQRWVGGEVLWWERPLLPLDLLSAVANDAREGPRCVVRGREAREHTTAITARELARVDPRLARNLFGRWRRNRRLIIRAWIDANDRAVRIWWAIEPRTGQELRWSATEFWDFGIQTHLEAPPPELVEPPATFLGNIHDLWRWLRDTKPHTHR